MLYPTALQEVKVRSDKRFEKKLNTMRDFAEENGFSTILINKLTYEFRFHENIKRVGHKEMIYKRFNYFPGLYEKLRYVILKHNINLIACLPRKLKELICTKVDPTPRYELSGGRAIPFRAYSNRKIEYIRSVLPVGYFFKIQI